MEERAHLREIPDRLASEQGPVVPDIATIVNRQGAPGGVPDSDRGGTDSVDHKPRLQRNRLRPGATSDWPIFTPPAYPVRRSDHHVGCSDTPASTTLTRSPYTRVACASPEGLDLKAVSTQTDQALSHATPLRTSTEVDRDAVSPQPSPSPSGVGARQSGPAHHA